MKITSLNKTTIRIENNQIIYVELIFCNYFYDIDYQDEIDIQYLPIGFDATPDNEYRQKRLNR